MDDTYIAIYRKLLYNGHFHLPHIAFKIFIYLLLKANRFPNEQIRLSVGECWVSYGDIQADCSEGDQLNLSRTTVSRMLTLLENHGYLKRIVKPGVGMKIKIINYRKYQEKQGFCGLASPLNGQPNGLVPVHQVDSGSPPSGHKQELNKVINIRPKFKFADEHMKMALYFRSLITKRKPDFKFSGSMEKWANGVRLLVEQDRRPMARIKAVLDWSQQNSFWQNNILSPDKLRKQFDRLEMEMQKSGIQSEDYSKVKL